MSQSVMSIASRASAACAPRGRVGPSRASALRRGPLSLSRRRSDRSDPPKRDHPTGATRLCRVNAAATSTDAAEETEIRPGVFEGYWQWRGHSIRYQRCGTSGPGMLLVHGFGGNADHWRKNLSDLGNTGRAYAIDLLGYGYSSKPTPDAENPNTIYNFHTWAEQLLDFQREVMGDDQAFLISNSIGGLPCLQAAVDKPEAVKGVVLMNVSLRMLHTSKQPALARPLIKAFQKVLRTTSIGKGFFANVAKPDTVKKILKEAYCDPETVTDELVECILKPGLQPGAPEVFLDFISYSSGPLPEDLLRKVQCPVSVVWGEKDPWEKVEWGREFESYDSVEEYVELAGVGHCPQDEAPQLVNPVVSKFVLRHSMDEDNSL